MNDDDLLNLARDEYDQQEKYSANLRSSTQFLFALTAALGSASVAMFKPAAIEKFPRWELVLYWVCAAVLWTYLIRAGWMIRRALRVQKMAVPRPLAEYIRRSGTWQKSLIESGCPGDAAKKSAADELVQQLSGAYAAAAEVNRTVNLQRQAFISKGTVAILIGSIFLAGQAVGNSVFVYREVKYGRSEKVVGPVDKPTTAPAASGDRHRGQGDGVAAD